MSSDGMPIFHWPMVVCVNLCTCIVPILLCCNLVALSSRFIDTWMKYVLDSSKIAPQILPNFGCGFVQCDCTMWLSAHTLCYLNPYKCCKQWRSIESWALNVLSVCSNFTGLIDDWHLPAMTMIVVALCICLWVTRSHKLSRQIKPRALASPLVILLKTSEPPYIPIKTSL